MAINSQMGKFPYILCEILMIFFFSYFWTTVQFSPDEMSKQLKQSGSFIPGYRPGPRTAEYLETVMERITYVGAGFLAAIAVIPTVISSSMGIPLFVSQFLGGTGLLIVVSVGLDLIQRIEANLLMRNYSGFLAQGANDSKAPRIRSRTG
jgi:preprotein translocase subunit SecY